MGTGVVTGRKTRLAPLLLGVALVAMAAGLALPGMIVGAGDGGPAPDLSAYPWFYLRDGRPLAPEETVVELVAVGDVMPGRGVAATEAPLQQVTPWLRGADLALGNLEAVLVEGEPDSTSREGRYLLWARPAGASMLAGAGFDLLSLANNHSLDAGSAGLQETVGNLRHAGIAALGAGAGDDAYAPVRREVRGVRLAFLAFNAVAEPGDGGMAGSWTRAEWDKERAVAAVKAARAQVDAVIVSMHWGYEYEPRADPAQLRIASELQAAGADLIVGHHPHVVQPVDASRPGGMVGYSLGNFLFDQRQDETRQGLALRAFFDTDGLRAVQALPLAAGPQPRLLATEEAAGLLARVAPPPRQVEFSCSNNGCARLLGESSDGQRPGLFWSGKIDLTGDGEPELVRRAAGQVSVYASGAVAWQSPAEWRVVDAALGDPNNDGRAEMLLALRRADAQGYERSQPYIAGYRGGEYQVLWGGRAVVAPILEVELGDVDGDGVEELVVLEAQEAGATVAVWRWQGWSFSLVWRSEPGPFRNLVLERAGDRMRLVVEERIN